MDLPVGDAKVEIEIKLIVRATERALKVCVDRYPFPIVWIPRSSVRWGETLEAGERDILIDVATWVFAKVNGSQGDEAGE